MESFVHDVRFGLRLLRKDPSFTLVAVLTLALGIGSTTSMFTLVNATLLRPLPASQPERLAALYSVRRGSANVGEFSYPHYRELRDQSGIYEGLAAQSGLDLSVTTGDRAQLFWGNIVSENYFSVLGMQPALGRLFVPEDDRGPGSDPIAVVSHDAWQTRFSGDPGVIGRKILVNGHPFTIVGVAPKGFKGVRLMGYWADIWVPLMMHAQTIPGSEGVLEQRSYRWLLPIGRMPVGMSLGQAQERTAAFVKRMGEQDTGAMRVTGATVISARTQFDNPSWVPRSQIVFGSTLGLGATLLVLLIACSNVANLLLARASARRKEIATRLALGATRLRLVRQLLTESVALAALACPLGLAFARIGQQFNRTLVPPGPFRLGFGETVDTNTVWFSVAVSAATAIVFGLAPAWRAARVDVIPELKNEATHIGSRRFDLRSALVVTQLAIAIVLLICGGLFLRSLSSARQLDVGFDRGDRFIVSFDLSIAGYNQVRGEQFQQEALRRVRALPGVAAASLVFPLPMDYESNGSAVYVAGKTETPDRETELVWSARAGEGYFRTIGTALAAGREFTEQDDAHAPLVAVINQTMARRYWPGEDAIGREFRVGGRTGKAVRVIGVARDGKYNTLGEAPTPALWTPLRQSYSSWVTVLVHAQGDTAAVMPAVRSEIQRLDPTVALFGVQTLSVFLKRALNLAEVEASLAAVLGSMSLLLAAIGLYGVVSYSVAQRTREVGIRMALGAAPGDVLRLVLGQALRVAAVGVMAGVAIALGATRVLGSLLYGVSAHDARTFLGAPLTLVAVALLAAYWPALRATKVDPMIALRYE